jgi:SAM-dependent methyltransferase
MLIGNHREDFINALAGSLEEGTFVKLTLGKYAGPDPNLNKLMIRLIQTKKGERMFFLYRYNTRDTAKNYSFDEGIKLVWELLGQDFESAHLFTLKSDWQIEFNKKGRSRLVSSKPTFKVKPSEQHNKEKQLQIDRHSFYLKALGVTDDHGAVKDKMADKWKQINKFVEIISNLFDSSLLKDKKEISIVDMGSGKGYLTFAIYDYFNNLRGIKAKVTGVDIREELVGLCNDVARAAEFENLSFNLGFICDYELDNVDILIALHACNTATDEAIYRGIEAKASLIICAPCCHQQLRPQMKSPDVLKGILRHGIMLQREATIATDGLRALLLERSGYATKMFEFVATEHTPMNLMIVGSRHERDVDVESYSNQIEELKNFYGVKEQRLEELLSVKQNKSVAL